MTELATQTPPPSPASPAEPSSARPAGGPLRRGLLIAAGAIVVTGLAGFADPALTRWLTQDAVRQPVEKMIERVEPWAALVIVLVVFGSLPGGRRRCVGLLAAILVHLPVLHGLKWAVGRMRPMAEVGAYQFQPFSDAKYADGFPSGHALTAGVIALLLGLYFPRFRWLFYLWAAAEGFKRILAGWHYLSDVLAGLFLAWVIVYVCRRVLGPRFYEPVASNSGASTQSG